MPNPSIDATDEAFRTGGVLVGDDKVARYRGQRGFSIIEVMVSVSIAGILAYSAVNNGGELFHKYALGSAVEQIAFEATKARMQAVGHNKFVRLRFYDNNTYGIEESGDGVTFALVGTTQNLPTGITIRSDGLPLFNRRGLATNAATIHVTDGDAVRSVRVDRLGNTKTL